MERTRTVALIVLATFAVRVHAQLPARGAAACPETPTVRETPPPDPNASPVMFSITPIKRIFVFCAMIAARMATS
jgi:hypothetical protein